jgi:hypothetical protein
MIDTTPVRDLDDSKDGQSADSIDSLRVLFSELDQAGVNSPIPAVRQNLGVAAAHVLLAIRDLEWFQGREFELSRLAAVGQLPVSVPL